MCNQHWDCTVPARSLQQWTAQHRWLRSSGIALQSWQISERTIHSCATQVEPTLINITPQLIDVSPRGVVAEAAGIAIENSLINIAPGGRQDSFHP